VHSVSEVRQIEMHTAESLAPDPSHFEVEIAVARFRKYKSPSSDQIPAELIQAGGEKLRPDILKLIILFGMRKDCLISGSNLLVYQFTVRAIKLTVVIINFINDFFQYHSLKVMSLYR
jgi:hypothetical protein